MLKSLCLFSIKFFTFPPETLREKKYIRVVLITNPMVDNMAPSTGPKYIPPRIIKGVPGKRNNNRSIHNPIKITRAYS